MASSIRLLSKLTTQGMKLGGVGGGGSVEISSQDVAAALGMGNLSRMAYLVGVAKFADDGIAQGELVHQVEASFRRDCIRNGWKQDHCRGIAELCVFELIWEGQCPHCHGRGSRWVHRDDGVSQHWADCSSCKSTGRKRLTIRERAAISGISRTRFQADWEARVDRLLIDLWSAESEVLRHLVKQFSELAA